MSYAAKYISEAKKILEALDISQIEKVVEKIVQVREASGRIFFLGVGGGAGHASHAVSDFRKIGEIECYAPTDNVSELTARINDEGWETVFVNWLKGSHLNERDAIFIFSVGGGSHRHHISVNLVAALKHAKEVGTKILGIVGRDGGETAKVADVSVIVPPLYPETVTSHTEAFQAVIWHLLISHPKIRKINMKWESMK